MDRVRASSVPNWHDRKSNFELIVGRSMPCPRTARCAIGRRPWLCSKAQVPAPRAAQNQGRWANQEGTFLTDGGEEVLRAGDCAGFPAQDTNGHCFQNRSDSDVEILEVGTRVAGDTAYYPDIDMVAPAGGKPAAYTHRDGTPYQDIRRRGP